MNCKPLIKEQHKKEMMAVQDSMDVLSGKWKIAIISSLCFYNKRRFSDILNDVVGISNKMLSKELKELEINKLIKRTVLETQPITVQYELTQHGKSLKTIISHLTEWGIAHRKEIIGNTSETIVDAESQETVTAN
ncbi:helix-turn-helix transcriptional regulator [Chryseobacterium sp. 09-1422]|uniref:Helix-turn-helix transcriptional regulator n=1 Tax=Chryseobacterium kimseyorum TaxID=2984028 RepID=A0ABT3HVP0_9FLAO|nr:helix-turn-helix domain-containing protein [Chryseobacterium kimseyorum]MCW3167765.1 helix-turn-helix transcriptional regulator [Chryseobacterium kimseyorum]